MNTGKEDPTVLQRLLAPDPLVVEGRRIAARIVMHCADTPRSVHFLCTGMP